MSFLRSMIARFTILVVLGAFIGRARDAWQRRGREAAERETLPSLYDRHPAATSAPRRRLGLRSVPLDQIVGTARHPSQNTADFLPLPRLRGENWRARWQRITKAMDGLVMLPPVELILVGEDYYVVDGHNRVGAALRAGGVEIDADVTQLILRGITQPGQATLDATSLIGADEVRQAGQGRHSRTAEHRTTTDELDRHDLLGKIDRDG